MNQPMPHDLLIPLHSNIVSSQRTINFVRELYRFWRNFASPSTIWRSACAICLIAILQIVVDFVLVLGLVCHCFLFLCFVFWSVSTSLVGLQKKQPSKATTRLRSVLKGCTKQIRKIGWLGCHGRYVDWTSGDDKHFKDKTKPQRQLCYKQSTSPNNRHRNFNKPCAQHMKSQLVFYQACHFLHHLGCHNCRFGFTTCINTFMLLSRTPLPLSRNPFVQKVTCLCLCFPTEPLLEWWRCASVFPKFSKLDC